MLGKFLVDDVVRALKEGEEVRKDRLRGTNWERGRTLVGKLKR